MTREEKIKDFLRRVDEYNKHLEPVVKRTYKSGGRPKVNLSSAMKAHPTKRHAKSRG